MKMTIARVFFAVGMMICASASSLFAAAAENSPQNAAELRDRAVATIRKALDEEQEWVKVHAAEYLLALGYNEGVQKAFLQELDLHGNDSKYRIGVWRVLARSEADRREQAKWIGKIRDVAMDPNAADRVHAIETLAKLGYALQDAEATSFEQMARPENGIGAPFAAWVLVNSKRPGAEQRLADLLESQDADIRRCAAYALRNLAAISESTREKLWKAYQEEPADSPARINVVSAAAVHTPTKNHVALKAELVACLQSGSAEDRTEAGRALGQIGDEAHRDLFVALLDDPNADVRITAANGILRLERRHPHRLAVLDWCVIAAYAFCLIAVGWYYSRRTKTREQYLLGDRQMKPLMVGLSMFAALISTITYLAVPGEIILYGPIFISYLLIYPLIGIFVGWVVIPFIMRLRVTSAYEILDIRLGPACRTLGSLLFLSLRLLWMAVIVYATTTKVLIPLLGLDPSATPLVCASMALVAIVYTSMGGLRAAVLTDVIQTAILCGAAVLTVVMISIDLGGVGAWWPSQWPAHWPEPEYGYNPTARVTMFGTMLATFVWYVCTAASDQIAVQRYLSTRDAKSARKMLFVSLTADVFVVATLGCVGLGLLAYFQSFPHLLPDNQTILTNSDNLFAQFIVIGLPAGVSGLVVAGLLACAMSSLAAGISSSCSVVTVDIIDRVRHQNAKAEASHISQLKHISVVIGLIVIFLSLFVNMVQGNLIEVCYKVVNLLTAPLAGIFFLAMFVPWAKGFGAVVGTFFGVAVAVAVSFWTDVTGREGISFIWAMPLSLAVEVGVGALVSLLPFGSKKTIPIEE